MKKEAINILKQLYPDQEILIKHRFLGGMSNYTYLAEVDKLKIVIRVVDPKLNVFVNRKYELDHLKTLYEAGFTNELIYFNLNTGTKISKYIEGESLITGLNNTDFIETAKTLKKLHNKKLKGHPYGFIKRNKKYESLLNKKDIIPLYYDLINWWFTKYEEIFSKDLKTLVHGDAQRSNLLRLPNQKIQLLDFEFSGMADPYYDIASFGNIDFNDSIKLLGYYLDGEVSRIDEVKVRFYRMYQTLQWYLVATFKENHGYSTKLHIDFMKYANNYLSFAEELYLSIKDDLDGI